MNTELKQFLIFNPKVPRWDSNNSLPHTFWTFETCYVEGEFVAFRMTHTNHSRGMSCTYSASLVKASYRIHRTGYCSGYICSSHAVDDYISVKDKDDNI